MSGGRERMSLGRDPGMRIFPGRCSRRRAEMAAHPANNYVEAHKSHPFPLSPCFVPPVDRSYTPILCLLVL